MLNVKRLTASAKLPVRGTQGSAGLDIFADESIILLPGQTKKISTGVAIELPENTVGLLLDRSSFGNKSIHNFAGVIDSDYRGELFVVLHYAVESDTDEGFLAGLLYQQPFKINQGDKITQLVIIPYVFLQPCFVDELNNTPRGINGFGSTGVT